MRLESGRRPEAILIAGPTASGKSALAMALADRFGGVVINADSMQVYRDLSVLTARPTAADEARVPHRLYGHVDASEAYSVGRYIGEAARAIRTAQGEGRLAIIVGGTGLYLKSLVTGLSPIPAVPDEVRHRWRGEAGHRGAPALHTVLRERDPVMADRLDPTDQQRIVRALEVLEATGQSLSHWQGLPSAGVVAPARTVRLSVVGERRWLVERVRARLSEMIREGAVEEVRRLIDRGLDRSLPIFGALGVGAIAAHLDGRLSLAEATEQTARETAAYIKRQMTWIKGQLRDWTPIDARLEKVAEHAEAAVREFIAEKS